MVENKNIDDNDLVILVMEMYVVYVAVGNMDQVLIVVVVVVVVVDINEYYDVGKIIVYVVPVEVDIEMLLYMDEMFGEFVVVVVVVDDYLFVLYNILVQNIFPDHLIVEYYYDQIKIN
jgi:hypothetical protein